MQKDIPSFNLTEISEKGKEAWNKILRKIDVYIFNIIIDCFPWI
jgi:hypothetical protein